MRKRRRAREREQDLGGVGRTRKGRGKGKREGEWRKARRGLLQSLRPSVTRPPGLAQTLVLKPLLPLLPGEARGKSPRLGMGKEKEEKVKVWEW